MSSAGSLKKAFDATDDEDIAVSQVSDGSLLSWSNRLKAFIACFALSFMTSLVGCFLLYLGSFTPFLVLYYLGTITSLLCTMFLRGPCNQLKMILQELRIIPAIVTLTCIGMTIFSAFVLETIGVTIYFCLLQFMVVIWYSKTYFSRSFRQKYREEVLQQLCDVKGIATKNSATAYVVDMRQLGCNGNVHSSSLVPLV